MSAERRRGSLAKRRDGTSLLVVSSHIAFVLLPVYLSVALDPSALLIGFWLWFGSLQQGLLNLMHECAHLHVFKGRRGSEFLAHWVLGPLMVVSFERYREVHWAHHTHLGGDGDPKYSYKYDIRGWRFAGFVLRSLFLVEAVRKLLYVHGGQASSKRKEPSWLWLFRTCVFHGIFVTSLFLTSWFSRDRTLLEVTRNVALGYGFVYVYGILSLTVLMANLRAIAEHQIRADGAEEVGAAALRNLSSTPLTHLIFGAYGFSEHATHHWDPGVPYYHLVSETERLAAENLGARPQLGYIRAIYQAISLTDVSPSLRPATTDASVRTVVHNR